MRIVITEKPSVARDLARVLGVRGKAEGWLEGDGLRIGWCFGHMAELEDPAHYDPAWKAWDPALLPMLPERFALRVREGAQDQVKVLKRLLSDRAVTEVINACDAGREGELIFRYLLEVVGCHKPVRRLWVSSLTDEAIHRAWGAMEAGARYDALADAARCRAEADWLVGLNATRAMTCLARGDAGQGTLMSVGRVQTPTLAMIVARDQEIAAFVPEDFWQVRARFDAGVPLLATFHRPRPPGQDEAPEDDAPRSPEEEERQGGPPPGTRLPTEAAAQAVLSATLGRQGRVAHDQRKRTRERPPQLYDLTALQRRANQRYGLSAARTLEVAQSLYEQHKLITYPRTDARHLTPDQVPELPGIIEGVGRLPVYAPFARALLEAGPIRPGKRVVDAAEVGDHHAILPTGRTPDPGRLSADEKRVYDLVARRLLAALSPDAVFDVAAIELHVDPDPAVALPEGVGAPLVYRARGRICVEPGWQAVDPPGRRSEVDLPPVGEGALLPVLDGQLHPGRTRPPPPHDDASILKAMDTAGRDLDDEALRRAMRQSGLGTPATRAAILATLEKREYVTRQGKHLRATDKGVALVAAVPVDELKSAELTGRWEARLSAIAEGRQDRDRFMSDVRVRTGEIVSAILAAPRPAVAAQADEREILGACPVCGSPVREGRGAWTCEKGRACTFVIFKKIAKREVSRRTAKLVLGGGTTPVMKGFKSKAGKDFEAALKLDEQGRLTFHFPSREAPAAPATPAPAAPAPPAAPDPLGVPDPTGLPCPSCGQGTIIRGHHGWGCDRWRQGCAWRRLDA
ncbi:DNA topoisomerase 3 [Myxococcota bacterium]|nr:DNA topoisomerase 3 [Myxococcota bacterium]